MNKAVFYTFWVTIIASLVFVGCPSSETPSDETVTVSKKAQYIPKIDRVAIPGQPYAYASVFYSAPVYALESGKGKPDYQLRDPLQKGFGPRLFPAHQADLKVALWHQVLPSNRSPLDFMVEETFVFYDESDEVIDFFHVDYRSRMVWVEADVYVWLDYPSTSRLKRIHKELNALE